MLKIMRRLSFKRSLARKILEGKKFTTLRKEEFREGELVEIFCGNKKIGTAIIEKVEKVRLRDINREIVLSEGFYSKDALITYLKKIYRNITSEDFLYLIKFKIIST